MRHRLKSPAVLVMGVLVALWLAAVPLLADEATHSQPLSLQDCIALAMKNQSDVLQGAHAIDAADARVTQAKSSYYPQVTVQAAKPLAKEGAPKVSTDGTVTMSVSQNLYDGGLRELRVKKAGYDVAQSSATLERTRQTVTYNVTKSYLSLLRAQRLAEVSATQVTYIQGQLDMAKARVEAGDAAEVDILPIEAQLANARVDDLSAKNAVRTSTIQLQQAIGLQPQGDFAIQDVTLPADQKTPSLEETLAQARTTRPEVRESAVSLKAAEASVKTAEIDLHPRPEVTGQLDQDLANGNGRTFSLNVGLAYDLFNGGNTHAVYDEARANLDSAKIRAAQVDKDIASEVGQAYLNLSDARERMHASEISVQSAQRNIDAQQERYQQGLAIPLDLLNAQLQLTTANSNAVQARYDYYTSLAQLNYAIGTQGGLYAE